jgi:hypothetical protein
VGCTASHGIRRRGGLRLPREAAALAPLLLQRERIERLVATLIELLDQLEDTDTDADEVEDLAPPPWLGGPGDAEDAEPALVPLALGRAAPATAEARR